MPGNRDGNPVESVAEPKPSLETSAAVALTRAEELRRLSRERWQSQLQLQQRERAAESTSGHLFNRADPYCEERDAFVEPYVRTKEPDKNGRRFADRRGVDQLVDKNGHFVKPEDLQNQLNETQNRNGLPGSNDDDAQYRPRFENNKLKYVPVSGHDFLSLNPDSRYKYRIPHDSVVNKVGDCKVCCCFGWRLTAAQWIWFLNLLCWFVHTVMVFVTFHYAYWQHKHPNGDVFDMRHDTEHVMVRIFRFSGIPTKEMIDNNLTKWSQDEWRNGTFSKTEFYLKDNDLPVNYASLVASFFAISSFFHLWALLFGICEATWFWYWRQMDDCFCYWRWIEYSASASIMAIAIAIAIGIREQSILAGIFMLHWCTMMYGLLTEYVSLPKTRPDRNVYSLPVGAHQFHEWQNMHLNSLTQCALTEFLCAHKCRRRLYGDENGEKGVVPGPNDPKPRFRTDYHLDPRALKIIDQARRCDAQPLQTRVKLNCALACGRIRGRY